MVGFEFIVVDEVVYGVISKRRRLRAARKPCQIPLHQEGNLPPLGARSIDCNSSANIRQHWQQRSHTTRNVLRSRWPTPCAALPLKSGTRCITAHKSAIKGYGDSGLSIIQQQPCSTNRHRGLGYLRPPIFDSDNLVIRSGPRRHEQGF